MKEVYTNKGKVDNADLAAAGQNPTQIRLQKSLIQLANKNNLDVAFLIAVGEDGQFMLCGNATADYDDFSRWFNHEILEVVNKFKEAVAARNN